MDYGIPEMCTEWSIARTAARIALLCMRGEAGPYSPLGRTEVLCVECYDLDTQ